MLCDLRHSYRVWVPRVQVNISVQVDKVRHVRIERELAPSLGFQIALDDAYVTSISLCKSIIPWLKVALCATLPDVRDRRRTSWTKSFGGSQLSGLR